MIKVLFIVSTLRKTGPINVVYTIINELDKSKFTPVILTLSKEHQSSVSMISDFEKINTPVFSLNLSRIKALIYAKTDIEKFVLNHNIQLIHTHGLRPDLLTSPSFANKIPIISSIHSNLYDDYTLNYGKLIGAFLTFLHIKSLKNKTPVACSNFVAKKLFDKYGVFFNTIHNGVSFKTFNKPSLLQKQECRKKLNLNTHATIFLSAASFISRKNLETIIKAFITSQKSENSLLVMLGDGPLLQDAKKTAENNNRILFLGNIPNVVDYFTAADYYISASLSEGLPIAVMEAMACGLPIILSNIEPHLEILNFFSDWPFKFVARLSNDLATKMNDIVKNDYNTLSNLSRDIIKHHLNSKIMVNSFEKLYINKATIC
jgi:glycosyltransferase involved in cell wall biosynthesis